MEWKLVLRRKKTMLVLAVLLAFQLFMFLYQYDNIPVPEQMQSSSAYAQEFKGKMEAVVQQADSISGISIFAQSDSFANRNLKKTGEDFQRILEVQPAVFDSRYLTQFFSCSLLNGIIVIAGIVAAMALVDEKKPGLRGMVFSAPYGRGRLVAERLTALGLWDTLLVLVFYGGTLLASALYCGQNPVEHLKYPIQSLPMFESFTWNLSIGAFLALYFIHRLAVLYLITLIAWTLLFCMDHFLLSFGGMGIIGIVSFVLVRMIGRNHPLNVLRYCNLWYQMSGTGFFSEYKNLNIFSHAVNKNAAAASVWMICVLAAAGIAVWTGCCRYPYGAGRKRIQKRLYGLGKGWQKVRGQVVERLTLGGGECYKACVSQKGGLVLLVLTAVFIYQTDFTPILKTGQQELYYEFMDKHTGPVTDEARREIEDLKALLDSVEEEYSRAVQKREAGELSDQDWAASAVRYDTFVNDRLFLAQIQEQTEYLQQLEEETGIEGWYINIGAYNHLLYAGNTLQNVLLVLGIVLICSGIFYIEKNCGMDEMVRSSVNGRAGIFRWKMITAFVLTGILFAVSMGLELASLIHVYGMGGLSAPIQSIAALSFVKVSCSVRTFVISLYLARGLMLFSVAALTCMLSAKTSQKTAVIGSLVICVPAILVSIGFTIFHYVSVVEVLSVAPFLMRIKSVAVMAAVTGVFVLAGIWSIRNIYKKWCVTQGRNRV